MAKLLIGINDLATLFPELVVQWDADKNDLSPQQVTSGSNRKVWWKCEKGHSWEAQVRSRALDGHGCPYCAGKRAIEGETDLATLRPDLAKEWDSDKNGDLKPTDVTLKSHKEVWWKCKHGHTWKAPISNRTNMGAGCPYCSGRLPIAGRTDLATLMPDIIDEWDYERNYPLTPQDVTVGSTRKVWWKCKRGHSWQAPVCRRTGQKSGCPYCAGKRAIEGETDLETLCPDLAVEWDYERNYPLLPSEVTTGSNRKVWWICKEGHNWQATVNSRVQGCGCPYCAGRRTIHGENDLATLRPDLAAEWDYERNYPLTPQDVTPTSGKKVWWKCKNGHSWQVAPIHRNRGNTGCPYCTGHVREAPEAKGMMFI